MLIQLTADGSHTIHSEKFDVPYHSVHGALQETMHVFIDAGLNYVKEGKSSINILEVGFGTGLNVLATLAESNIHNLKVDFHTIEAYPISEDDANQLNYQEHIARISQQDLECIHEQPWGQTDSISANFSLTKHLCKLEEFSSSLSFDVIYFDAFAPTAQPELWEPSILRRMYDLLTESGVLVTYCAKGQFKRDLKSVGFMVDSIPGPPRKREMTRAIKT